ncbi:MAG: hypothetical protein M1G31_16805 [Pseudanabaena sp. Salubria-1]|nr:hypothetical protein [Pseudanabaena sp. Salubria-1]MCX5933942.1 hypothetical protein [Pseudanabaena sp. LacPavin_0818_WC45_MAG_42_6]
MIKCDSPLKKQIKQRSPIHSHKERSHLKKSINPRSPIHPINSDRLFIQN